MEVIAVKKWYLKLSSDNIILDVIEYPFEGYIEVELPDTSLPAGINGGWYRWNGTTYQEDSTLKPVMPEDKIVTLETQVANLQSSLISAQTAINSLLGV